MTVVASRAGVMSKTCFQHAPPPSRRDTRRTTRLLEFQKERELEGHVPQAGAGGSPLAKRNQPSHHRGRRRR